VLGLLSAGCLPFVGGKGEPPRTPAAVQRFAAAAGELGVPPSAPPLPEVTRLLAGAVESLPNAPGARERGREIAAHAQTMHGAAADSAAARQSVELALQAAEQMRKPAGSKEARARALAEARQAVDVAGAYRALAQALVLFTGGPSELAPGVTLPALVAHLAVADDEAARHTGAQVLYALVEELRARGIDVGDLAERANGLAGAAPLEYAAALRDALERAVDALRRMRAQTATFDTLRSQARDAVQRIARDRPFELQRPAVQDAFRLIADAITVASRSAAGGR
jgi:hypothetical protein